MKTRSAKAAAAAVILIPALLMQGCSLGIGEEEFSCPGRPDGVQCKDTWELYAMTNNGKVPVPVKPGEEGEETAAADDCSDGSCDPASASRVRGAKDWLIDRYVAPRLPGEPVPVRTPAQVMRIWIAPYEDTAGSFVMPGYVYREIEPRRWTLGVSDVRAAQGRLFTPLKGDSE